MKKNPVLIAMLFGFVAFGCGSSDDEAGSSTTGGAGGAAPGTAGALPDNTGGTEPDPVDSTGGRTDDPESNGGEGGAAADPAAAGAPGSAGGGSEPGGDSAAFGFAVRAPQEQTVTCSEVPAGMPADPAILTEEDFVCTLSHEGVEGHVYVQATPTDCQILMGAVPTTFDANGWLSVDGTLTSLEGLSYDHGGNHFNNTFEFTLAGKRYRYAHSSIGFGGRSCQPPDCLQVYGDDGTTLLEDGCTVDRTLPVACVAVEAGGVVPELSDTFTPCPGDPNYE